MVGARWIQGGPFTCDADRAGVNLAMTKVTQQIVRSQLSVVSCKNAATVIGVDRNDADDEDDAGF
jgi:hypothetical protein